MGTGKPSPNRTVVLDSRACAQARQDRGLSREGLADQSRGAHPLSVATIKRAEAAQPVYLETARRLAELLQVPLAQLLAHASANESPLIAEAPGISVLPFCWLGPAARGNYLAAGLTEDLLSRLARGLFPVVATPIVAAPAEGLQTEGAHHAQRLGVRYWVEGSVRREGTAVRVIARLVEAASGRILWTQTYDRTVNDVLAFQHEVAARIVQELGCFMLEHEGARLSSRSGKLLTAWELSLKGAWHFRRQTRPDNQRARGLLQEALRRDRGLPLAWYTLAMTYRAEILNRWSDDFVTSIHGLNDTARDYAEAHPDDAGHHVVCAYVRMLSGDRDGAVELLQNALDVEPSNCTAYSVLAQIMAFRGEGDQALERFEMALRLRPVSPENWTWLIGMALCHFVQERYEESLHWADKALAMQPSAPVSLATRAVACVYLGDERAAQRAVKDLVRVAPDVDIDTWRAMSSAARPENAERFFAGLGRAGLRDRAR
jgi:TolB-like protein